MFDFRATLCHSAPIETQASGFKLRATPSRAKSDFLSVLGAALWTSDLGRAKRLVRQIDAGAVFVNGLVASDPRPPFGGLKQSGYGRELGSYSIREFINFKTVWVGPAR